jgi:hypothetical protein
MTGCQLSGYSAELTEISGQRREQRCHAHQFCRQKIPSVHSMQDFGQFLVVNFGCAASRQLMTHNGHR